MSESDAKELVNLTAVRLLSHSHPLTLTEKPKNELGEEEVEDVDCYGCGELIQQGSSYCCINYCKFYLHKTCADLPLNMNHPLHQKHTLNLEVMPPYYGQRYCDICFETVRFVYHCSSCDFDLDVKCALFPEFSAGDFSKLQHFSHEHPLVFVQLHMNQVKEFPCAACDEPTSGPIYSCIDCSGGFYLHKKCAELPHQITHPSHHKHPLILLANPPAHQKGCSCHLCKNPNYNGFIYHCSFCEFGIRVKHIFSSQSENGSHQHPFTLLSKPMPFICDACGTDGDCIPYICTICNLAVHKDCISLPHTIKIRRHLHPLSHIYFFPEKECRRRDCKICHNEVNTEYGSYYCSYCNYFVHVNCAREIGWSVVEGKDEVHEEEAWGLVPSGSGSMCSAQDVTATEIKHFSHKHNLMLSEETIDDTYCVGCMVTISGPFYFCAQCDFFLHKSCAKLPMKTHFWFSSLAFSLLEYGIFSCSWCWFHNSGFAYQSERDIICLRCCGIPDTFSHEGHEHPIFFDHKYKGNCGACGIELIKGHRCKNGDFSLDYSCMSLPQTVRHKNDKHPLTLTYHDGNDPSQYYCDVCEEERDPTYWFYSCADCNFTAHPKCTLGRHPFINECVSARFGCHPHRLSSVKKVYYYPPCEECHKPCLDLALECKEPDCNYIIHWDCRYA